MSREPTHEGARQRRLLDLVDEALERPKDEREAFLAAACGEDRALLGEARELLALEPEASALTETGSHLLDAAGEALDGLARQVVRIDGYRVLRLIGEGGMGRVFEAEQETPRRTVALKTLRAGLENDRARQRFLFEAELLARLRHPGIAAVYDVGTYLEQRLGGAVEVPYFAMEFVEGARDLVGYARLEKLGRKERLELFLALCDAVQHGHDRGVLHRDLKSTNVLVGLEGRPKVIDFGIARPLVGAAETPGTPTPVTRSGELFGTPSALAPEQLEGAEDVDVRADVYALGLLLYGLICDAPPVDLTGLGLAEAARRVLEDEPRRASRLAPDVDRDLDAILYTAVVRERDRRYPSAQALADDLERYLAHEPIHAAPPGPWRQLGLLARRHRAAVVAAGAVLLAILAGSAASATFGVRAARAARDASAAAERERVAAAEASLLADREREARSRVVELSASFVFDFAERIARMPGSLEVRAGLLESGLEHLAGIEDLARTSDRNGFALVSALTRLGDLLGNPNRSNLGQIERAVEAYDRAAALLDALAQRGADAAEVAVLGSRVELRRGEMDLGNGAFADAEAHFERALEGIGGFEPEGPPRPDFESDLSQVTSGLGAARGLQGDHQGALEAFQLSLRVREARLARSPEDPDERSGWASAMARLGAVRSKLGEVEAAVEHYEAAIETLDALAVGQPSNANHRRGACEARIALGKVLIGAERFGDARTRIEEALDINDAIERDDPSDASYVRYRGDLCFDLGRALEGLARGVDPEARAALHEQALEQTWVARACFEALRDQGRLLGRESGVFGLIDARIAELEALGGDG